MPGLIKLLALIAIGAALWYVWNLTVRVRVAERLLRDRGGSRVEPKGESASTVDLVACPVCGDHVARGSSCGRADCPFGR